MSLLSLPLETLHEIFGHFACQSAEDVQGSWGTRTPDSLKTLLAGCRTCKTLSGPATALLYRNIVLKHHSRMVMLLRTLVGKLTLRGAIRSLSICFSLKFDDTLTEDFSVREYYLNEAPGYDMRNNWDLSLMDPVARDVFVHAGLDCAEFRAYDEYELESLNDGTYWSSIPDFSDRLDREERLVQCITLALICLANKMTRLRLWLERPSGSSWKPHLVLDSLNSRLEKIVKNNSFQVAPSLVTLVIDGGSSDGGPGALEIPALRDLVLRAKDGRVEREDSDSEDE